MTGFEFGDVVLVRFPSTDHSTIKQRPAAVISSAGYHRARPDLLIMAISSQVRPRTAFGEAEIRQWKEAGLLKPSVIKPVIATIEPHPTYAGSLPPTWCRPQLDHWTLRRLRRLV